MPSRPQRSRTGWMGPAAAVAGHGTLLAIAVVAGRSLDRTKPETKLGAAPFVGGWDLRVDVRSLLAPLVAAIAIGVVPFAAVRLRWWATTLLSAAAAVLFGGALAVVDGWSAVIEPVVHPTEYWDGVRFAKPIRTYLATYIERGLFHSVHVRGHPPGMSALLIGMRAVHLRSPWAAAALSGVGAALTVFGVAVTLHRLLGRRAAATGAALLALTPYAVWQMTSADALFAGVAAVAVAALALAATSRRHSFAWGLGSGVLLGAALFLTYGAVMLVPIGVGVVVATRRPATIVPVAIGVSVVMLAVAANGFWWIDGLSATRRHYWNGTAKFRPPAYFALAGVAVLGTAIGAPVVASLGRLPTLIRERRSVAFVVLGALVSVVGSMASQMSKGEVERIWLLFMPWLSVAGLVWFDENRAPENHASSLRMWMTIQAVTAIALQAGIRSKW